MVINTPPIWPTWWKEKKFSLMNDNISSVLKCKKKRKIKGTKLTKSALEIIATDIDTAEFVMENLNKYVLNLDLAKALAMAWLLHDEDNYPAVPIKGKDEHRHMEPSDFHIKNEDLYFLCEKSAQIELLKGAPGYVTWAKEVKIFEIRDEIDDYFENKKR